MSQINYNCWQVTGPPGTGKTTWLIRTALAAIEKHGPGKILVASLTRAAAYEFSSRGLSAVPRNQLGTLHSICLRALGRPEIAESPKHREEWCEFAVAHNGANYQLSGETGDQGFDYAPQLTKGDALLSQLMLARNRFPGELDWKNHLQLAAHGIPREVALFREIWELWKRETGYLDFTDLLEQCILHVERAPGDPAVMFGDEAQDWSKLETQLFRDHWGRHAEKVILVGDPDQAIFEWRGADPRIFLDYPVPEGQRILLEQSYRVPRTVRDAALKWIEGQIRDRAAVVYRPRDFDGLVAPLRNHSFRQPERLLQLLEKQEQAGETTMVIASCGYMLHPLLSMMRKQGIPFANPYRVEDGSWNPLRRGKSHDPGRSSPVMALDRMIAFLAGSVELRGAVAGEWTWQDIHRWIDPLPSRGDHQVLAHGAKKRAADRAIGPKALIPGAYTMEEFGSLFVGGWDAEHAHAAHKADLKWWLSRLPEKVRDRYGYFVEIIRRKSARDLLAIPRLWIGTAHSFKGGEADNVILFPDLSLAGYNLFRYTTPAGRAQVARLFYVAMTRAKQRLYLCAQQSPRAVPLAHCALSSLDL